MNHRYLRFAAWLTSIGGVGAMSAGSDDVDPIPVLPATPDTETGDDGSVRDRNRSEEDNERAISFPKPDPENDRGAVLVRIERWEAAGRRRDRGGLVLYIHGFGIQAITQTQRSRSIDDARAVVIDALCSHDVVVPADVTIIWTDNSH